MTTLQTFPGRVTMFGAFDVWLGGRQITPTAPKQCQLLALLLLHAGEQVSRETIAEELWAMSPPPTYRAAIHTYVMQLRRTLEASGPCHFVIDQAASRYSLTYTQTDVDLEAYRELSREARHRGNVTDRDGFIHYAREAISVWCSEPLADVRRGPVIDQELRALASDHTRLHHDLSLELIRIGEVVEGLSQLVDRFATDHSDGSLPLRFYCLARLGRRAEALRLYSELPASLVASGPWRWLQAAHADLLNSPNGLLPYDHYTHQLTP